MLEEQQRAVTSGAAWTGVRQRLDELDESLGTAKPWDARGMLEA